MNKRAKAKQLSVCSKCGTLLFGGHVGTLCVPCWKREQPTLEAFT